MTVSDLFYLNPVRWVIAIALVPVAYYLQSVWRPEENSCKPHPPVPPRMNANGTIDHVNIYKCGGKKGHYVVVRFSQNQEVLPSAKMEPTEVSGFGGPTVTLSSSENQYVSARYDLSNSWELMRKDEKDYNKYSARITFSQWSDDLTSSSLASDMKDAEIACSAPIKHPNGLLEYRSKNGRDPKEYPSCFSSRSNDERRRIYVQERPSAYFDCSVADPGNGKQYLCYGRVDTPEKVHVSATFFTVSEPNPDLIGEVIKHVTQRAGEAFLAYGELQADEVFDFEKIQGVTK